MTLFTSGRLQAYERMMQQVPTYRERYKLEKEQKRPARKKTVPKDGERDGRHPS